MSSVRSASSVFSSTPLLGALVQSSSLSTHTRESVRKAVANTIKIKEIYKLFESTAIYELSLHLPLVRVDRIEEEVAVLMDLLNNELSKLDGLDSHLHEIFSENDPIKRREQIGSHLLYILWNYLEYVLALYGAFPTVEHYTGDSFKDTDFD